MLIIALTILIYCVCVGILTAIICWTLEWYINWKENVKYYKSEGEKS